MPHPIILYDGICGLCNRFVRFVIARDRRDVFRFASLQGATAARVLARHRINPATLDTVYVVLDHDLPTESLLPRSNAVLLVLSRLGWNWRLAAALGNRLPEFVRDAGYNAVAIRRYRIFGRLDRCLLPRQQDRGRFLDF